MSEDEAAEEMKEDHKTYRPVVLDIRPGEAHKEPKYIVFLSMLLQLLTWLRCPSCGSALFSKRARDWGTLLMLSISCYGCGVVTDWYSQSFIGSVPAGNMLLSASILFSGSVPSKALRMLNHMGVRCISSRTFFRHQRLILHTTVNKVWEDEKLRNRAILEREDRYLALGGDGRCDSPGHSAKFGTYTVMELDSNIILETQVFTV